MLGDRELSFEQYVAIVKRRKWWLAAPTLLVPIVVYLGSLLLPNLYRSQTLVLVEEQKVPDNFVKPVVNEELNERLATMQEQILSRTRLQPLIERFRIFPSEMNSVPMDELVDRMRKMISVTAVHADFGDTSGPKKGLPGFYISFSASDPHLAQQVCGEITSMFMEENLKAREQSAEGTTQFLSTQLDDAKRKLDEQDAKLAAFKQRYIGQLPDQEQANLSVLSALNGQLDAANQAVARAQQDKTFAESMLAQQMAAWKASRSGPDTETLQKKLDDLQSQLTTLEARYTSDYPDVAKTKAEIAEVQKEMESAPPVASTTDPADDKSAPSEPQEIRQLRLQIHQLEDFRIEKTKAQEDLQKQIRSYQSRIQMSPVVEQEYKALTRDYQTALSFYNDLLAKKTQSAMATDLERKQQGEQFRVMDPPNLPEKPTSPNRPMFALGGFGGGFALGLAMAFLIEVRDKTLRTDEDVLFYLRLPVLTHIPTVLANGNGKPVKHKIFGKKGSESKQSKQKQQQVEA
jgi:polysaccharide chain length determinant protein (PEP-CTERM system associated)